MAILQPPEIVDGVVVADLEEPPYVHASTFIEGLADELIPLADAYVRHLAPLTEHQQGEALATLPGGLQRYVRAALNAEARTGDLQRATEVADGIAKRLLADEINRGYEEKKRSEGTDPWTRGDAGAAYDADVITPTVGAFLENDTSNGGGIFYAGKINEVHGPSESGKTMLALAVAAQEIRAGRNVVMIDYEDDITSVVGRFRDIFGLTRQQCDEQLFYFNPGVSYSAYAHGKMQEIPNVAYVILDAVTEAMTAHGLSGRVEGEVAQWFMECPRLLAKLGWAVCAIDHVGLTEGTQDRATGSQHKKSAVDGVSYTAEKVSQFVKGARGKLRLRVAKDKPGGVRPMALPGDGQQHWRGDLVIDGSTPGAAPSVGLWGVNPNLFGKKPDADLDKGMVEGPTWEERQKVLLAVKKEPGLTKNALKGMLGVKAARAVLVIESMARDGEIRAVKEGQSIKHYPASEPVPDHEENDDRFPDLGN